MNETIEEEKSKVDLLQEHLKDYLSTRIELAKLTLIDKSSKAVSLVAAYLVLKTILGFFLLFASIGLAFFISEKMGDNYYAGFFSVALIYLLAGLILYFMKDKWLRNPILNLMIKKMNSKENGDEYNH